MTSETSSTPPSTPPVEVSPPVEVTPTIDVDPTLQVRLKSDGGRLVLTLPPDAELTDANASLALTWGEIWQQFKQQLDAKERFLPPATSVDLVVGDRLLDNRQLQAIADALSEAQLQLKRVFTSRRQTAVAAATAGYSIEQQSSAPVTPLNQAQAEVGQAMDEPLYVQMTLRSGTEIRHNGTVVVLGDLNPGSSVIAEGDILVWGRLRGVAHAGCKGNARCLIMALQLEPTQLRIADFVARAPETPPAQYHPEVAYVAPQGNIRIARATEFVRQPAPEKGVQEGKS